MAVRSPLAAAFEETILAHRVMPLDSAWQDEVVFPYYQGLSIRNLAHTIVRLLEGRTVMSGIGTAPLDSRLWMPLDGKIKRVVLFLTDGLGWRLLQDILDQDPAAAQAMADLVGDGTLTPITSVVPSTTAAALPCIWTGAAPAATGMVGTQIFLREFSTLVSMLHFWPDSGTHRSEVLEEWGLNFENFMPVKTLGESLKFRQIPSYVLLQKDLYGSGLSRLMHRGVQRAVRHYGYTDLWIELRNLLVQTRGERCFVSVYWGAVDGVSHLFGTTAEHAINEIRRQLVDLRDTLLADGAGDGRTLFMLSADHGHTPVPDYIDLSQHPPILEALRCGLGGEGRMPYLYLRHDYVPAVRDMLRTDFTDQVIPLHPAEALAAGLFGPEKPYSESAPRLGDLALITRRNLHIGVKPLKTTAALSRHGGMSDREMLVPLLMRVM